MKGKLISSSQPKTESSVEEGGDGTSTLPRIRVRVLGDELIEELRSAIIEGSFAPGSRLIENDIAEQMGVSRAPVREAIRALEREGLVEIFPHRGAVVLGVVEDELEKIYELRALAEAIAFERAATRLSAEDLDRLDALVTEMREQAKSGSLDQLIETDLQFHRTVIEASGYRVILRLWDSLAGITRARTLQGLMRKESADYFLSNTYTAHHELVDALRDRSTERVRELVDLHIADVASRMRVGAGPTGVSKS